MSEATLQTMSNVLPPLELSLDEYGRRTVPLASLRYVLEAAMQANYSTGLELLHEAVCAAQEAPLPGHTPERADRLGMPEGIPGLELAEPVRAPELGGALAHPGAYDE